MSKELQQLTNGTYTLMETEDENQFFFFRNDHEKLSRVRIIDIMELFSKYLIENGEGKEEIWQSYTWETSFVISKDGKIIRLTVNKHWNPRMTEKEKKPKLTIWGKIKKKSDQG